MMRKRLAILALVVGSSAMAVVLSPRVSGQGEWEC